MNLLIDCPHCHVEVSVPANMEVGCPRCRQPVIAEAASAPQLRPDQIELRKAFWFILIVMLPIGYWLWSINVEASKGSPPNYGASYQTPSAAPASRISNAALQSLIADVYKVETSRFIQPDLLWITLPAYANAQKTCQAIANLWAARSGLDFVRVECRNGNQLLGQGTVHHGQTRMP